MPDLSLNSQEWSATRPPPGSDMITEARDLENAKCWRDSFIKKIEGLVKH
jgi:hypothetical protein